MRFARPEELGELWRTPARGGRRLSAVVEASYADFEDLWAPFPTGVGPAGAYAAPGRRGPAALRDDTRGDSASRRPLHADRPRLVRRRARRSRIASRRMTYDPTVLPVRPAGPGGRRRRRPPATQARPAGLPRDDRRRAGPGGGRGRAAGALRLSANGSAGSSSSRRWDETPRRARLHPQSCGFRDRSAELGAWARPSSALGADDRRPARGRGAARPPPPRRRGSRAPPRRGAPAPDLRVRGRKLYKRLALVAEDGRIVKVFYPVFPPDENAAEVAAWLRGRIA